MGIFLNIIVFLAFVTNLLLGGIILIKNYRNPKNYLFSLVSFSAAFWALSAFLFWTTQNPLFWGRMMFVGPIIIAWALLQFSRIFPEKDRFLWDKVALFTLVPTTVFVLLSFTDFIVKQIIPLNRNVIYGLGNSIFGIYFGVYMSFSFILIFKKFYVSSGLKREQIKYLFFGILFATLIGTVTNLILPLLGNSLLNRVGPSATLIATISIAYAIIRYRLMDIRIVITRAVIFIFVYFLVLGIPFWLGYLTKSWIITGILMFILATSGIFIYNHLRKQAENLLLAEKLKRYNQLKKFTLSLGLVRDISPARLCKLIVYRLIKTLGIEQGAIYLLDKENQFCFLAGNFGIKVKPNLSRYLFLEEPFIRFILEYRKEFLLDELENFNSKPPQKHLNSLIISARQFMKDNKILLVIPYFLDKELIGFLALGKPYLGTTYSEDDLDTLKILSHPVGLAILNAVFVEELKKTQLELTETARIAQIGYLASSIEHQINNVLNTIVQAGNFLLETLELEPENISLIKDIISKIVKTAYDGSSVIEELRSFTKKDAETKFELVDLREVVKKTLNLLYLPVGRFHNIQIEVNIADDVPLVWASFVSLENVFLNLLNNAYDAIQKMFSYIKEHSELIIYDYKPKITINIIRQLDQVHIHVIDNGIGMTQEVKRKVFTPLFTTKGSYEKRQEKSITGGQGIGLYTILIIIKNHGGTISVYRSEPLKGTDFLITLPVPKQENKKYG